jgi:dihydroneopterin aldolase
VTASFYQSELINYFQNNKNLIDLENYRSELNQKADSLIENNIFEIAAQLFEKCENISQLFVQIGKEEEIFNIQEFKRKKEDCLKSLK